MMKSSSILPLLLLAAWPAAPVCAIHQKNAGPEKVEIKFNLPPPAPLTPEESLKTFTLEPGYRMEIVAAEPLIEAPVAMSWDDQGRLYVAEMRGYMTDAEGSAEMQPTGRIRLLEDTDRDGKMDKASDFVDGLILPRAVMAVNGGVLVGAPPQLLFCKDTNGDGKADVREEVAADFGTRTGQPEHMANSPVWAMDNAVWVANSGTRYRLRAGTWTKEGGLGRGQYGLCQDDFGRLYYNYNSDLLRTDLLPAEVFARNPLLRSAVGLNHRVITDQTVWPAHPTPGVNRGYEAKTLRADGSLTAATAVCGALIYRGHRIPAFKGSAFIPEPSGNLVKRVLMEEKDGIVTAKNATPGRDFLTSTDERFRPVVAADGPDGALYLVDMARGIIQHSGFLTHYLKANIEARKLTQPVNLGRIWRIVPEKAPATPPVTLPADSAGRAAALSHASGWVRDTAQRLLVESAAPDAAAAVLAALPAASPTGKVHALWTLHGLGALTTDHLRPMLSDADAKVRATAVRLAGRDMAPDLIALAAEKDALVRAHLAIQLSALSLPDADAGLAQLLAGPASPLVNEAALTGLRGRETAFAKLLTARPDAAKNAAFLESLAALISAANKAAPFEELLTLAAARLDGDPAAASLLKGLSTSAGKQTKLVWFEKEPASLAPLRSHFAKNKKLLTTLDARLAWPGKPGAPPPPKIEPLTPAQQVLFDKGRTIYTTLCAACHQPHGFGLDGLAPPLVDSEWVLGRPDVSARIILHGLAGPVKVGSRTWDMAMPPLPHLTDEDIAATLTYIRREWEHGASPVSPEDITKIRARHKDRTAAWTAAELKSGK